MGKDHQLPAGDQGVLQSAGLQIFGMGQSHHPPAGQRLRHFEPEDDFALFASHQPGEEKGRLTEVGAGFGRRHRRGFSAAGAGSRIADGQGIVITEKNGRLFTFRAFSHRRQGLHPTDPEITA